eukprot:gene5168-2400_t
MGSQTYVESIILITDSRTAVKLNMSISKHDWWVHRIPMDLPVRTLSLVIGCSVIGLLVIGLTDSLLNDPHHERQEVVGQNAFLDHKRSMDRKPLPQKILVLQSTESGKTLISHLEMITRGLRFARRE